MKRTLFIVFLVFGTIIGNTQTTYFPSVSKTNAPQISIDSITITNSQTFIYLSFTEERSNLIMPWVTFSPFTYITDRTTGISYEIEGLGNGQNLGTQYRTKRKSKYNFILIFPQLPPGTESIDIVEYVISGGVRGGFEWEGISINNPDNTLLSMWNEESIKTNWKKNGLDVIEGIYENTNSGKIDNKYRLALIRKGETYEIVYLGGNDNGKWEIGDIKAILNKTASPNIYKVKWYMADKRVSEDLYITFDTGLMKIIWTDGHPESLYIKLYPTSTSNTSNSTNGKTSGTGFAISTNGYIATNYHVVKDANKISVRGIKGDFSKVYTAKVVIEDKNNDLAIIKIDDINFTDLGNIPYTINNNVIDVGNSVYALGYPLRATMGDEVKLTNGIISSRTGFQGDITTYQISIPLQPGNSGGPLFNSNGDIVGIVNAKHLEAENASYAVKANYLTNLFQVMNSQPELPNKNTISTKRLSEQVKFVKEYIYILEIN
ncbi:MAG: trypsin-like peptidase domain-containing protein [Bacteroidales bacterium]|nr:trypsin-like peptidase domain-containing protein [Bacteroidales bacterium]MBN2817868.1 trypsin-like peptidase domain-containing protein [Bacteroidales bacterium]